MGGCVPNQFCIYPGLMDFSFDVCLQVYFQHPLTLQTLALVPGGLAGSMFACIHPFFLTLSFHGLQVPEALAGLPCWAPHRVQMIGSGRGPCAHPILYHLLGETMMGHLTFCSN